MLNHTEQFDYRFIARTKKYSKAAAIFIMLVGLVVLAGWLLDISLFKSMYVGISMKANTALLLVLSGASLWLLNSDLQKSGSRIAAQALALAVALLGALTLSEHIIGWNLGIDQLLFKEAAGAVATASPGRMGPPASTSFVLAGTALLLLHNRRAIRLAQLFSIFICLWALLAIIGFVYEAEELYKIGQFTGIAVQSAIALFVLGLGLLAARINEGITKVISSARADGITTRRLLFIVVVVPFFLGWMRIAGQRMGYYDLGFGTALVVLSIIIVFSIAIWQTAAKLSQAENLRAAAEHALSEKEEGMRRQATLIELSYEPILICELEGGIIEWNRGCELLYGFDRTEALGQISHDLLQTQFPVSLNDYLETLRRDGNWSGVLRHLTRAGQQVAVECRHQVIDSSGKRLVLETNRNVTEQLEAVASRLRLAAIVSSSNDAIISKTLEGVITSWNEGAERIFGYTEDEAIGQSVTMLIPPDRDDEEPAIIQRLKRGEMVDHYETVRVRKDGSKIDISLTISPIRNAAGEIIGASKVARDISESKRAENSLRERERMQRVLAQIGEAAARSTEPDNLVKGIMAQLAEEMGVSRCGYTRVDLQAGRFSVEDEYHGKLPPLAGSFSLADYAAHFQEDALAGRTSAVEDLASDPQTAQLYEQRYKAIDIRAYINVPLHRDLRWMASFWISHHEPHRWSRAEVDLMRIVADRVSLLVERRQAEQERERLLAQEQAARQQAETANRIKDEFLATVSHELRTPLNAILGWSSMLRGGRLDEADSERALETIERNARSQAQLIEDILDVSRSISGKLRLNVKPIELISVIKAAVDAVRPAAEGKNVQLQLLLDPAADQIQADATRMQQVIWNLLANAIKYTPEGGLVQLKLERIDSRARITISDTGEGISAEFLPYVFNRFQQADGSTTRRHGGLGLGLSIARHLVEMHGGTIEAASAGEGKGATFTVSVPIAASRSSGPLPEATVIPEKEHSNGDKSPNLAGLRILAVDDEADVREMLRTLLEGWGARVLTASSAQEGLETLAGWQPHVLISDIGMPGEDGYSLIRKVRALTPEQGANTPAIALTGYVRVEERMRALEAGYQMFVPKPVETAELKSIIGDLVVGMGNPL